MAKMTKMQTEHALERLKAIHDAKATAIKAEHTTPGVTLSEQQRWQLVLEGKVKIASAFQHEPPYRSTYWTNLFDWSDHDRPPVVSDEGKRLLDDLATHYRKAKDEIILGDALDALELLRAFESD